MNYSIIIPAHNSEATISRCINAILASNFDEEFEIIVVDDGSQDNTAKIAERLGAQVIRNTSCRGPAFTRNLGAKNAKSDIYIFIDSDVLLFEDTLQKITDFLKSEEGFVAVSCNFYPRCEMVDTFSRYKHLYTYYSYLNQPKLVNWTFTSALAVKKSAFENIRGFNERLLVNEDNVFGKELRKKGYKVGFCSNVFVHHLHRYPLLKFIREEIRRSRTVMVICLTYFFQKTMLCEKNTLSAHMIHSMLIFPFFLMGLVLIKINFLLFLIPLLFFYSINFVFLALCKKEFGLWFMLQTVLIILFDCFLLSIGATLGMLRFLKGQRI